MVITKHLLVMLAWLQAAVTDGHTSSEQSCGSDDGSAYLQRFAKESSASSVLLSGNSSRSMRACNIADINAGLCLNGDCTSCLPAKPTIIPTTVTSTLPGGGFPDELLKCEGNTETCTMQGGDLTTEPLAGNYYQFRNPEDSLSCKAIESGGTVGSQICKDYWNIDNVAAVCCTAEKETQQVCYNLWFSLSKVDTRDHDICCDGFTTCYQFTFLNVDSLSCRGEDVCYGSINPGVYTTDIAKNLYCDGKSLANTKAQAKNACYQTDFTFGKFVAGDHCITCKNDETCRSSNWRFPNGGNVQMQCLDVAGSGLKYCYDLNLRFDKDACIYLNCNDGLTTPQGLPCDNLAVLAKKASGSDPAATVDCRCDGRCSALATSSPDSGYNIVTCTVGSGSKCGLSCSTDDTACCKSPGAGQSPQCGRGSCVAPPPDVSTSSGQGVGDPHIDTFDGQHYLLLKQGSFSFWRFSGSDAEIFSAKNHALLKKLPVDFKIYAHYSGHKSYTKGLLLVDSSGATTPQRVLELTSEDCTWRTKTKDIEWSAVEKPQLLSLPDADGDEMTAFRMTEPLHEQNMYVELLMKKADGAFKKIGNLYVRCKPGYHINTKITMSSKEDIGLVQGQVGAHGHTAAGEDHKASFLQGGRRMRSDSEFVTSEKWTDLGGSAAAETYLSEVDEEGESAFLKDCSGQEKIEAEAMCKKYLGEPPTRSEDLHSFENRFDNCVFDVCNGGGEVAAELAAEIFHAE